MSTKAILASGIFVIICGIIALIIAFDSIDMGSIAGTVFSFVLGIACILIGRWEISMSKTM